MTRLCLGRGYGHYLEELEGHQTESFLLEAFDDVTDETTLDTVGFDSDEGPFSFGSHATDTRGVGVS